MSGLGYQSQRGCAGSRPPFRKGQIQFVKRETIQPGSHQKTFNQEQTDNFSTPDIINTSSNSNNAAEDSNFAPANKSPTPVKPLMSLTARPSQSLSNRGASHNVNPNCSKFRPARQILSKQEYFRLYNEEQDPALIKLRKLALEVVSLNSERPNAVDKIMSACNRVPVKVDFNAEQNTKRGASWTSEILYRGVVKIEGVEIGFGKSLKLKDSKISAFEMALQKLFMPFLRVVQLDPVLKELQSSNSPFPSEPPAPSKNLLSKPKFGAPVNANPSNSSKTKDHMPFSGYSRESNADHVSNKRQANNYKSLQDFVIVEPKILTPDFTPAHTLRRSADFNQMLLEMEYFAKGSYVGCILRIENTLLADVKAGTKVAARHLASEQALEILRRLCWVIKTKQTCDSDTKLSKDEMIAELNDNPNVIKSNNVGHKLLQKMGWSGGGVGKDGSGIAEPIKVTTVLNRQGLGLSAASGITDEFRRKMHNKIREYASSDRQDDLVFANDFNIEERKIIHDECRKLNLKSKSTGKGNDRYLCARRKRSAFQLFDHIMASGGETFRYVLVPPGSDGELKELSLEAQSILENLKPDVSLETQDPDGSWGPSSQFSDNYGNRNQNQVNFTERNFQQNVEQSHFRKNPQNKPNYENLDHKFRNDPDYFEEMDEFNDNSNFASPNHYRACFKSNIGNNPDCFKGHGQFSDNSSFSSRNHHRAGLGNHIGNNPDCFEGYGEFNDSCNYSSLNRYENHFENMGQMNNWNGSGERRGQMQRPNNRGYVGHPGQHFEARDERGFYGQNNMKRFDNSRNNNRFRSDEPVYKRGRF